MSGPFPLRWHAAATSVALGALSVGGHAQTAPASAFPPAGTLTAATASIVRSSTCFAEAGIRYGLSETLLRAIATVESRYEPRAVHRNSDGTRDVGVMQVNSSHFQRLQAFRISEASLLDKPCLNVAVGAAILAGFVRRYGPTWRAVGAYGAGSATNKEAARGQYAALVNRALLRMAATSAEGANHEAHASASRGSTTRPAVRQMLVIE